MFGAALPLCCARRLRRSAGAGSWLRSAAALGVQAYLAADIAQDHIAPEAGEAGSVVVG
jgi:hypothetical protein